MQRSRPAFESALYQIRKPAAESSEKHGRGGFFRQISLWSIEIAAKTAGSASRRSLKEKVMKTFTVKTLRSQIGVGGAALLAASGLLGIGLAPSAGAATIYTYTGNA